MNFRTLVEALCLRIGCRVAIIREPNSDSFTVVYPQDPIARAVDRAWEINR